MCNRECRIGRVEYGGYSDEGIVGRVSYGGYNRKSIIGRYNLKEFVRTHVILTPVRVEEVPNRSKWFTSGTASISGDEFQINEKHKKS